MTPEFLARMSGRIGLPSHVMEKAAGGGGGAGAQLMC